MTVTLPAGVAFFPSKKSLTPNLENIASLLNGLDELVDTHASVRENLDGNEIAKYFGLSLLHVPHLQG